MTVCAIHQPNFFPWLGYFDKIRQADVFVFLDEVAYPKSGSGMGSWCNRVRIEIAGSPAWFGCPVVRAPGQQLIRDVRFDDSRDWRARLLRTLEHAYAKAENADRTMPLLAELLAHRTERLAEFNIETVKRIAAALGITARFVRQSELAAPGQGTERLIAITRAVGADTYLCGGGAAGYQDDAQFERAGLMLRYQDFEPFRYGRGPAWLPGLSVIDYLMKDESAAHAHFRARAGGATPG